MLSATVWEIMLPAFAECLVLTGLHAYLGLHVLRRKVIFVDLTLAQIAALGTTVGALFGMSSSSPGAWLLSLAFTLVGAGFFALTRTRSSRVPQEAVIGLVYAVAAALAILLVSESPNGAKEVKDLMTGRLLWVGWGTVALTAAVYAALGLLHFALRRRFLLISEDPEEAWRRGMRVRAWDFLFYASFGVAISLSVRTAGVLLVFVFLVVPATVAITFASGLRAQLAVGWIVGVLTTAAGLAVSYAADVTSGPTVVALYGLLLVPVALVAYVRRAARPARGLRRVAVGAAVSCAVVAGFWLLGRGLSKTAWAHGAEAHEESAHGAEAAAGPAESGAGKPGAALLQALEQAGIEDQEKLLAERGKNPAAIEEAFELAEDPALRVALAKQLGRSSPESGAALLLKVLESQAAPFEKAEAADALESLAGREFGFDPEAADAGNAPALAAVRAWLQGRTVASGPVE